MLQALFFCLPPDLSRQGRFSNHSADYFPALFMLYKLYQQLRHRLSAHTRHGIHSPFVYRFIAEGLQPALPAAVAQQLRAGLSRAPLLYRILRFSAGQQVWIVPGDPAQLKAVSELAAVTGARYAGPPLPGGHCDVLWIGDAAMAPGAITSCGAAIRPDSIVIINNPHRSKEATREWEKAKEAPPVRMSIDLFHVGLLLYRPEFRVKQDFKLRTYD
jgi:hypothetical protein